MRNKLDLGHFARLDVSRETLEALQEFEAATLKWSAAINLIAAGSERDLWRRHIQDSAQLLDFAPEVFHKWCDIGAGGGFPGLVLAILCKRREPRPRFVLVESDSRKCAFLKLQASALDLPVDVVNQRIESMDPAGADILSARALAPLPILLQHAQRHLSSDGICLFPKGRNWQGEVDLARKTCQFDLQVSPSIVDPESRILVIRNVRQKKAD
ncbi:MAG: 16S rRNA (guanine(527)-N(7))-methyltransferase RsmG [Rhodobacter sp.]|nr:16S rRNA (guanine(527)-N(7))-methyltransferase RsmG [Alphaproteobacteria bacterium]MCC0081129.1 16S rRNA (guanine(527)-N(7))-methyltransferase RsmG [Rhodobacter sp.]